jgi:hypothetical protein
MPKLTNCVDALICAYEDLDLEFSLLSLVVLDFLVSTNETSRESNALQSVYGFSDEQLEICYTELSYYGYISLNMYEASATTKAKKLFNKKTIRMTTDDRNRLEKTFEVFWKAYPIRIGKKRAKFEWMKLRPPKELVDKIMSALDIQIKYKASEERRGRFVPEFQHAERWIKHARYDDEYVGGTNYLPPRTNTQQRDER